MSHGLVADYTDSEEEEQEINEPPSKKLKLPNPLKNNSFDNEEVIDDPALHDFRVRSFPHVRGNWATYVFIQPTFNLCLKVIAIITVNKKCVFYNFEIEFF